MLKFEVNTGTKLLRAALATLISSTALYGCNATTGLKPQDSGKDQATSVKEGYCYKGGRTNDYSCDPEKATAQADMRPVEIDDAWMTDKLSEIRKWIAEEKKAVLAGRPLTTTAAGNNTQDEPREYLSTISMTRSNSAATSPELEQILRLSQQGKHREALTAVNAIIAEKEQKAAATLAKGIILSNMGDKQEAKMIFTKLMRDYPDRPEAFNNLAVIYSEEGNYPQAIETLQQAFSTHPSYAQVHSNLKELYATLASQAYNKALDLGDAAAGPELAMINRVPASENGADKLIVLGELQPQHKAAKATVTTVAANQPLVNTTPVAAPVAATKPPQPEVTKPIVIASNEIEVVESKPVEPVKTAPQAIEPATEKPATPTPVIAEPAEPVVAPAVAKATPITPETKPAPVAAVTKSEPVAAIVSDLPADQIKHHLQNWADAWQAQNYQGYVDAYTADYRPNAKLNHQQWVAQRQQRITKPKFINVRLEKVTVKLLRDNLAEARFNQFYQSDNYKDAVRKRVMLVKSDGGWKISLERSLGLLK